MVINQKGELTMKGKNLEKMKRFLKKDSVRLGYYTLGFAAGVTGMYLYHKGKWIPYLNKAYR